MPIISPYTHLFKRKDKFYIFNAESRFFCDVSEDLYALLFDRSLGEIEPENLETLIEKRVIIKEEERYLYYNKARSFFNKEANKRSVLGLVIAPTLSCNFACPYCFEDKSDPKTMTDEVEDKLMDFIKSHDEVKTLNITWYGGEPLIAFARIRHIYNRIVSEFPKLKIGNHSLVTNGYLINDEVIDFFKNTSLKNAQITLDGTEENHNRTRCLKTGEDTFKIVCDNIIRMAKALPDTKISVRVNVNRKNSQDYHTVYNMFRNVKISNISVYPGYIREDASDGCSMCYDSYDGESCYEFKKDMLARGIKTDLYPGKQSVRGCIINSLNGYIIGPEGEIYKCWNDVGHKDRIVSRIDDTSSGDKVSLFRYLNEVSPFDNAECRECKVFPICSGGCGSYRYRNLFENGHFDLCTYYKNRGILEDALIVSNNQ